jgi:hypothetical protein
MIVTTVEHLLDEEVSVVQLDGLALGPDLPKEVAAAIAEPELLADRYGKQFMVGQI